MTKTAQNLPDPPVSLKRLQEGFGASISTPFIFAETSGVECQLDKYDPMVVSTMVGRGDLTGVERLAIYNQQYWFRLLTVMQEEYPLFERVLGVRKFNRMVSKYLCAYPSQAPSLRHLSDHLVTFLNSDSEFGTPLHVQVAELEYLYIHAFDAAQLPPLEFPTPEAAEAAMEAPLRFQPHVRLIETQWTLVECRRKVRKDPEITNIAPEPETGRWVVYRGRSVLTRAVGVLEWRLLTRLFDGMPFAEACDTAAEGLDDEDLAAFAQGIQQWFAEWAAMGWFAASEPPA